MKPIVSSTSVLAVLSLAVAGCLSDAPAGAADGGAAGTVPGVDESLPPGDPTRNEKIADSTQNIDYMDDLARHPGCSKVGIENRVSLDGKSAGYVPADIPGFPCSAKEYPVPPNEDTSRPIIVLVHGNSSTPLDWESYPEDPAEPNTPMVAETLVAAGFHVYAADLRFDRVTEPTDSEFGNPGRNVDHGWATPIVEALVRSLHAQYPTRKLNLAGFSLGSTVIRDALRRLHRRGERPFEFVGSLLLASGAHHGVVTFPLHCVDGRNPKNKTMRGRAACQLGNRDNFVVTPFHTPLNGPAGAWETPCSDGVHAFGQRDVCGGNKVRYTTVVYKDPPNGPLQDEFVSEKSAALLGADNKTVTQEDATTFFVRGQFKHHNGSVRSPQGVAIAVAALTR